MVADGGAVLNDNEVGVMHACGRVEVKLLLGDSLPIGLRLPLTAERNQ
jgi:hypothetical protein